MSGVHDDLATLREYLTDYDDTPQPVLAALDRVEAEIARLEDDLDRERDNHAALLRINQHAAEQWEARCARLQQALGAYRSALRSGEPESERMRAMGDEALAGPDTPTHRKQNVEYWRARSRVAVAECARLQQALADAKEARRGVISACIAVKGKLDQPYPDDNRWTPWTRFVEPALRRLDEALAGLDTPADSQEDKDVSGEAERHRELVGSRIEDVRVDGGLVYIDVSHRGTDDEACTLLVRAVETKWRYPRTDSQPEDGTA